MILLTFEVFVLTKKCTKINFEDISTNSRPFSQRLFSNVLLLQLCCQLLYISMFFLNNFISWQKNEVLFLMKCIKNLKETSYIIEKSIIKLLTIVLLYVKKLKLYVINSFFILIRPVNFLLIQFHSHRLISRVFKVWSKQLQMSFFLFFILFVELIKLFVFVLDLILDDIGIFEI